MFCPKCGSLLVPKKSDKKSFLYCPSCGYTDKKVKAVLSEEVKNNTRKVDVINPEDTSKMLPKTATECPKCGNNEAYFWLVQTRASDEPETKFFKCTKCGHTWRDYS